MAASARAAGLKIHNTRLFLYCNLQIIFVSSLVVFLLASSADFALGAPSPRVIVRNDKQTEMLQSLLQSQMVDPDPFKKWLAVRL